MKRTGLIYIAFLMMGILITGCSSSEFIFHKSWGTAEFKDGQLHALRLQYGSDQNVWLPQSADQRSGIYYSENGEIYSSAFDEKARVRQEENLLIVEGELRTAQGQVCRPSIDYRIEWEISDIGYIKVGFQLDPAEKLAGKVEYRFGFNGERLNRYYYSGFKPESVRTTTSLMKVPMDTIPARTDTVFHYDDYALGRYFGFVSSETEILNFVVDRGYIEDVTLLNSGGTTIAYTDSTPSAFDTIRSSFYILPAPVRELNTLRRLYTSTAGPQKIAGSNAAFVDTLARYGFQEYLYHNWKKWNFTDTENGDLTFLAWDPEGLADFIEKAHARNIKVILYLNLLPEEKKTVWYRENQAGQWATEHPFSLDMTGRTSARRDIMCLNSPHFEHRVADADHILDDIGADGVYIDWFTLIGCSNLHPYHENIPATNISKLIALIEHVKSKGKLIYLHSGEESRIPFLEEYAGYFVCGERGWDRVNYASTASGVFDRWSTSTGHYGLIFDSRYGYSEAENRLEVNAAILEGLNPFGYVYRTKYYGTPKKIQSHYADQYLFDLLLALQPFDLESMQIFPGSSGFVQSSSPDIGVTVLENEQTAIWFVVNKSMDQASTANLKTDRLRPNQKYQIRGVLPEADYGAVESKRILQSGLPVTVPANSCHILAVTKTEMRK